MKVAIAGGGIGGLTAAVALQRVGADVKVYEQSARGAGMGSGIGLWANALQVLEPLGVAKKITGGHVSITAGVLRDWDGRSLLRYPIGQFVPDAPVPFVAVRRSELHEALLGTAGEHVIEFGCAVQSFEQDDDGVTLSLTEGRSERCDILIGADGIRSRLRTSLFPGSNAYYTGWTVWQGIAPISASELPDAHTFQSLWARDAAAMLMPMTPDLVFWFVSLRLPPRTDRNLKPDDLRWPLARLAVDRTPIDSLNRTDLYEARPLRRWVRGRVALLGDAAHAMRPTMGMGGCQAIEDAFALAFAISHAPGPQALIDYQTLRRRRANQMWWQSFLMPRLMNPQRPIPNWARNIALKALPMSVASTQFRRMLTPTSTAISGQSQI